jgi:sec-independent protein translocase protein TatC
MANETEEPRTDVEVEEDDEGGPVKTFLEHLEDLRWVLIKSSVTLGLAVLICLIAGNWVVGIVKWPLDNARISFPKQVQVVSLLLGTNQLGVFQLSPDQQAAFHVSTNQYVALQLEPVAVGSNTLVGLRVDTNSVVTKHQKLPIQLINLSPAGGFFVAFQVAFYGGIVMAAPFIFYFVAQFVFPALRMKEKKYVYRGLGYGVGLFMCGVCFCYFALLPVALAASVQYSEWLGFSANQWRAEDYISFVCKFMLGMGLGFELPVVILVLVKIGVLNYRLLSKGRRYMIVINLVLGALLTTPEVITQILMALPLQVLYEITVWIAWWWERKERKRQAALEASGPAE